MTLSQHEENGLKSLHSPLDFWTKLPFTKMTPMIIQSTEVYGFTKK